jgi:hypothetical protein
MSVVHQGSVTAVYYRAKRSRKDSERACTRHEEIELGVRGFEQR